ncbi:MAG: radical SAM protein, partial [Pseudomonadota bacterium]
MGLQGEGEWAFPELLRRLKAEEDLSDLAGLFLPGSGNKTIRRYPRHLNDLPWSEAARWLRSGPKGPGLMVPVQTRRGCPMSCSYCSTPVIEGRLVRKCSPARAAEAVASYMEAGLDRLFITDNTFNLPPSYAKDFCRVLISRGLKPDWHCIVHPGQLDEELIELMARAGCTNVSLGFESGSDRILRRLNKRFTQDDILR